MINVLITLGEPICKKIKQIYFPDEQWSKSCYTQVAKKYTELKQLARKVFVQKTDEELLKILSKFSERDIEDMFKDFS